MFQNFDKYGERTALSYGKIHFFLLKVIKAPLVPPMVVFFFFLTNNPLVDKLNFDLSSLNSQVPQLRSCSSRSGPGNRCLKEATHLGVESNSSISPISQPVRSYRKTYRALLLALVNPSFAPVLIGSLDCLPSL